MHSRRQIAGSKLISSVLAHKKNSSEHMQGLDREQTGTLEDRAHDERSPCAVNPVVRLHIVGARLLDENRGGEKSKDECMCVGAERASAGVCGMGRSSGVCNLVIDAGQELS
jgi:hypothetical protein